MEIQNFVHVFNCRSLNPNLILLLVPKFVFLKFSRWESIQVVLSKILANGSLGLTWILQDFIATCAKCRCWNLPLLDRSMDNDPLRSSNIRMEIATKSFQESYHKMMECRLLCKKTTRVYRKISQALYSPRKLRDGYTDLLRDSSAQEGLFRALPSRWEQP